MGAAQGFVISVLLFYSGKDRQTNRLLALLIFLIALACLDLYGSFQGWFDRGIPELISYFVPMIVVMPFGPLIFFYVKSSLDPGFKMSRRLWIHFYPVVIDCVPQLTAMLYFAGLATGLIPRHPQPWGRFIDTYNVYSDIPRWISVSTYTWLSIKNIHSFKIKSENLTIFYDPARLRWLQQLTRGFLGFQVLWLLYLIPYVIPRYTNMMLDVFDWYPLYVPLAVLVYWLGIKGYLMAQQARQGVKKGLGKSAVLEDAAAGRILAILKKAMEDDRLYLDPLLNLQGLARHTGIAPKTISAVLNQHLHKNFNEFVNAYRVEAFKEKLLQPEVDRWTIAGIASECGFNSSASFQRIFKQTTGMSPSVYRSQVVSAGTSVSGSSPV
ncbi:helix-turn-helix domain-containing protein [Compostibacter hankyongensis]|uniref:helix-turn-helix domain-containing protein n=1 Tax=Compostibacter hankyongensis TaxID=1007089 RepID=UPI0031EDE812